MNMMKDEDEIDSHWHIHQHKMMIMIDDILNHLSSNLSIDMAVE
jgi:hypothetical protein